MRFRSVLGLVLALSSLAACATTGAVRVPLTNCTTACFSVRDRAERFACMQSCPGAAYSEVSCSTHEPAGSACISDPRPAQEAEAGVGIALGLLEIFADVNDARTHSCHYRRGGR